MSTPRVSGWLMLAILLSTLPAMSKAAEQAPALGRPLSATEVNALPKPVFADGSGLPAGSGDTWQGAKIYAAQCASCHGSEGQGASALELVGDRSQLATAYPDRGIAVYWPYAPVLFEYVRRAMPPDRPNSLSVNETYAVIARLLELNGLIDSGVRVDAELLRNLPMPNRNAFFTVDD